MGITKDKYLEYSETGRISYLIATKIMEAAIMKPEMKKLPLKNDTLVNDLQP